MSYFEAGFTTLGAAAGSAFALILNSGPAGKPRMRLVEIGFTSNAATLSQVQLVRAATVGVAAGAPIVGQCTDDLDPTYPVGQVVTSWTGAPTVVGTPFRPIVLPAVAGAGTIWTWPADRPVLISPASAASSGVAAASGAVAIWNAGGGAASALSGYVVWQE